MIFSHSSSFLYTHFSIFRILGGGFSTVVQFLRIKEMCSNDFSRMRILLHTMLKCQIYNGVFQRIGILQLTGDMLC